MAPIEPRLGVADMSFVRLSLRQSFSINGFTSLTSLVKLRILRTYEGTRCTLYMHAADSGIRQLINAESAHFLSLQMSDETI